jgi:hypothetical protein
LHGLCILCANPVTVQWIRQIQRLVQFEPPDWVRHK